MKTTLCRFLFYRFIFQTDLIQGPSVYLLPIVPVSYCDFWHTNCNIIQK